MYTRLNPHRVKYKHAINPKDFLDQRTKKSYEDNGCLMWLGGVDKNGYGQVHSSPHTKQIGVTRAHQLSYFIHKGPYDSDQIICHTCDNPTCVNPDHLYAGTWKTNVRDCVDRGRYRNGSERKVSHENIISFHGKLPCDKVASLLGVSFSLVCQVWRRAGKSGKNFHKGNRIGENTPE